MRAKTRCPRKNTLENATGIVDRAATIYTFTAMFPNVDEYLTRINFFLGADEHVLWSEPSLPRS